jgi:hypothetical protein
MGERILAGHAASPAGLDGQNRWISKLPGIHFLETFPCEPPPRREPSLVFVSKNEFFDTLRQAGVSACL